MTSASQCTPAIAKNGAPMIGATPSRPGQLILQLDPAAQPVAAQRAARTAPARSRPRSPTAAAASKRQRHDHSRDHEQPVDHRVEQRAETAVLAGQPGGEAVEVVAPTRSPRTAPPPARRGRRRLESATTRNTGIPASRTYPIAFGTRPRVQRLVRRASRPAAAPSGRCRTAVRLGLTPPTRLRAAPATAPRSPRRRRRSAPSATRGRA